MRIGFDLRPFLREETGVGVYLKNLLHSLSRIDYVNEYFLFSCSLKDRFPAQKLPSFRRGNFRDFHFPVRLMNTLWNRIEWPPLDFFFKVKLDLTHSPTPLPLPSRGKRLVTVYDFFFMDFPYLSDELARRHFYPRIKDSLQKVDGIIAISNYTKAEIMERFRISEERIQTVYLGLDHQFWCEFQFEELEILKQKLSLPVPFILFVGVIDPRKNLPNLISAFKIVRLRHKEIHLLLVGRRGSDYQKIRKIIQEGGLEREIRMLGYVSDEELKGIYFSASLFVFPSLCEGFGLPLLEAMACGLPVAASKIAAIPEIAGDCALYFNPYDPEDMADKIISLIENETLRQTLITKGKIRVLEFDWLRTAQETLNFYQKLCQ